MSYDEEGCYISGIMLSRKPRAKKAEKDLVDSGIFRRFT
jgi:hypothetical protein